MVSEVAPNPVTGLSKIEVISGVAGTGKLLISNLLGGIVSSQQINLNNGVSTFTINGGTFNSDTTKTFAPTYFSITGGTFTRFVSGDGTSASPYQIADVYALQSLDQIIHTASREQSAWPLLEIEDAPRFAYRGFMLDIARNFYDLEKIKQVIDAMGYYKLNYLDLRLSDDEGWRIEIPGLPELTKVGGKRGFTSDESDKLIPFYGSGAEGGARGNGFLSKDDFMILLTYAHEKNITVLPQISFPSHARAAIRAMATRNDNTYRLVNPQDQSQYRSAQLFNDNVVCICQESAFDFYEKVVLEMKAMYEASGLSLTQFSIGADELPYGIWKDSPLCKAFMKKKQLVTHV